MKLEMNFLIQVKRKKHIVLKNLLRNNIILKIPINTGLMTIEIMKKIAFFSSSAF